MIVPNPVVNSLWATVGEPAERAMIHSFSQPGITFTPVLPNLFQSSAKFVSNALSTPSTALTVTLTESIKKRSR